MKIFKMIGFGAMVVLMSASGVFAGQMDGVSSAIPTRHVSGSRALVNAIPTRHVSGAKALVNAIPTRHVSGARAFVGSNGVRLLNLDQR